uniref:CS domain-containing protein n=1 Tax=Caenorhabditis tropicalis TaxID=1561998 RepID=A0A1I7TX18_9PELO
MGQLMESSDSPRAIQIHRNVELLFIPSQTFVAENVVMYVVNVDPNAQVQLRDSKYDILNHWMEGGIHHFSSTPTKAGEKQFNIRINGMEASRNWHNILISEKKDQFDTIKVDASPNYPSPQTSDEDEDEGMILVE